MGFGSFWIFICHGRLQEKLTTEQREILRLQRSSRVEQKSGSPVGWENSALKGLVVSGCRKCRNLLPFEKFPKSVCCNEKLKVVLWRLLQLQTFPSTSCFRCLQIFLLPNISFVFTCFVFCLFGLPHKNHQPMVVNVTMSGRFFLQGHGQVIPDGCHGDRAATPQCRESVLAGQGGVLLKLGGAGTPVFFPHQLQKPVSWCLTNFT